MKLEQRIASALDAKNIDSGTLSELIAETEMAATAATKVSGEHRERAIHISAELSETGDNHE